MLTKMYPPTYFIIFLALSIAFYFLLPNNRIIFPPYTYMGIVFIVFGTILNAWSSFLFERKNTTIKPHEEPIEFLDKGPFKISRNPIYLGMAAILLGIAIFYNTLIAFLFPILFIILMDALFIPLEEKNLEKAFGHEYKEYKSRVRRWL